MGYKEFRSLAFELSCRVLLGFEMNKDEHGRLLDAFETFMSSLFSIPIRIPGLGLDKGMKARETMLKKIKAIILQKQNGRSSAGSADALSLMMGIEGKEKLEMEEAKDVALELIGSVLDLGRINKLKYVRNVVKEALRISPPIGGGYRKALHTFEIEGYQIPRGWSIVYSIRDSHETSPVVNKPEVFNPERWSGVQIDDREHYFPFGGGKKGCAGREFAMLMLKDMKRHEYPGMTSLSLGGGPAIVMSGAKPSQKGSKDLTSSLRIRNNKKKIAKTGSASIIRIEVTPFGERFHVLAPVMTLIGYTCHEEKWDTSGFGNLHQALKSEDEAAFCITFD
uniref:Cytochrome P450 26B1 n=1 Tax=Magallana gigas TaxID=29159 RepID=K1PN53_MAGGI